MTTYGKKKRSILSPFPSLRDSDPGSRPKPKKEKTTKRGSVYTVSHKDLDMRELALSASGHDDSIEEMASMLLDDTTIDHLKPEAGKRLSQTAVAKALPILPRLGSQDEKNLPQLPRLVFNGDDAWAMRNTPVVTAAGSSNQIEFNDDHLEPPTPLINVASHARKSSAPPVPRRSSKRKSGRPKSHFSNSQAESTEVPKTTSTTRQSLKNSISHPQPLKTPLAQPRVIPGATEINEKVEAMMAATRALKPGSDSTLLHGPLVPAKKKRLGDGNMLSRMKIAFNDRFQTRSSKKRDSTRDGRLLDKSLNELQDFEEDPISSISTLTAMELRMNEGDNFKNPKIFNLTGHGNVRRKPITDDGKSLQSHKSYDDPFSERPSSNGTTRVPTNFEHRLKDDTSIEQGNECISELPTLIQTPKKECLRIKKPKTSSNVADFDALISSSPLGQSTPRIRLEPSFEKDGRKTLKKVPSESRSLFDRTGSKGVDADTDVELSEPSTSFLDGVKRKSPDNKDVGAELRHHSKKMKKHPSPSKSELEGLEKAMANFPSLAQSESFSTQDDRVPISLGKVDSRLNALAPKDVNKRLRDAKRRFGKADMATTSKNIPSSSEGSELSTKQTLVEAVGAKSRKRGGRFYFNHNAMAGENDSIMDMDELQWDDPAYHIGARKV